MQHHFSNVHISIKSADFLPRSYSLHFRYVSLFITVNLQQHYANVSCCKRGKKKTPRRKQTLCMRRGVRPLQDVNLNATRAASRGPESLLWEGNVTRYRFKCSREIIKYHR